jgi:hypothetical protein
MTGALLVGGPSCVPPEAKAIAWVACPSGYVTAEARQYNHNGGNHWCVSCKMADGSAIDANETRESAASVGFAALALACGALTHLVAHLFHRRRT